MMDLFWKSYSHHTIGFVPLILCLALVCFVLGGCSTTSETFDCKAGQGVGCKSISEVNQMVDQGTWGSDVETLVSHKDMQSRTLPFHDTRVSNTRVSSPVISVDSPLVDNLGNKDTTSQPGISLSDTLLVHRIPEQHLRVWIAPFQDAQGNCHEGSIVHTVLKPGFWQISPSESRAPDSRFSGSSFHKVDNLDPEINSLEESE